MTEPTGRRHLLGGGLLTREEREMEGAYGLSLLLVIASIFMLIASGERQGPWSSVAGLLQAAALIATFRVAGARRRTVRGVAVVVLLGVFVAGALSLFGGQTGAALAVFMLLLVVLSVPVVVLRRLAHERRVSEQVILGLLVTYLMIGLVFAYSYLLLQTIELPTPVFSQGIMDRSDVVYFSYITLATVGYGDITPVAPLARSLAVTEALLGQLYLVSVVALAVGAFGRTREHTMELAEQVKARREALHSAAEDVDS